MKFAFYRRGILGRWNDVGKEEKLFNCELWIISGELLMKQGIWISESGVRGLG